MGYFIIVDKFDRRRVMQNLRLIIWSNLRCKVWIDIPISFLFHFIFILVRGLLKYAWIVLTDLQIS